MNLFSRELLQNKLLIKQFSKGTSLTRLRRRKFPKPLPLNLYLQKKLRQLGQRLRKIGGEGKFKKIGNV